MSILLLIKCTGGWLNCRQSHFWPVTKSNEPTFELHFLHFNFPFVHSDCSISSWSHCSNASSIKYTSVRPDVLVHSLLASKSIENSFEWAFMSLADATFVIIVLHLRHLICVSTFASIFGDFLLKRRKITSNQFKQAIVPLTKAANISNDFLRQLHVNNEIYSPIKCALETCLFTNISFAMTECVNGFCVGKTGPLRKCKHFNSHLRRCNGWQVICKLET